MFLKVSREPLVICAAPNPYGACVTVTERNAEAFACDLVPETVARTNLGILEVGEEVNIERPVRATDRLGGHIVQGHVDGVATVERVHEQGDTLLLDLRVPPEVAEISVPHGSITVDGVSLTVNELPRAGIVQVALIPFTRARTTLGARQTGDRVHVEGDVLGKYVRQLCRSSQ